MSNPPAWPNAYSINLLLSFAWIDFRRFQFELEKDISSDAYGDDATYALMKKLGDQLGERIRKDQFAPNEDPQYDPEGLCTSLMKYREAIEVGLARSG